MFSHLKREHRLILVISISASFFLAEIAVGFYTRSLALVADAFHYLNDLVGFIVALVALKISQRSKHPKELSFGWQRAKLLGAFFNGVFLLSLGISIFLQSVDRFVSLERIENPKLVLIIGCVGLALNLISGLFLHEHDHGENNTSDSSDDDLELSTSLSALERRSSFSTRVLRPHVEHRHNIKSQAKKGHDLGMMGVLIHVLGDAANNIGVIIAALVIWKAKYEGRYYADRAVSMAIAIVILLSSLPLVRKSGTILLQSVPLGVDPEDVKHDLEAIPGVESVHELHIWRLNQEKTLASVHLAVSDELIADFMDKAKIINECFHVYGIHSTTLQPEHVRPIPSDSQSIQGQGTAELVVGGVKKRHVVDPNSGCSSETLSTCLINCGKWNALNRSIDGTLVAVQPVAAPCHINPNSTACQEVTAQWSNSVWRAAQPGAVQWENWAAWPEHNESCYVEIAPYVPCKQGRISLYSAVVQNTRHIQEAVRFAKRHTIRLAIKNSGHDFLGRSAAPNSLQILTNRMKGLRLVDDFVPKGAPKHKGEGPAVTLDAGISLQEMYAALGKQNRTVVGGSAHTVGLTGGYIQGGGHSFLSPWKGMASDNALEFSVVTAAGDLVTANAHQNSDLFWALRGGGGGTFGIVTQVTVRTFEEIPLVITSMNITTAAGDPAFWNAVADFHAALPAVTDARGGGYYFMVPNLPWENNQAISVLSFMLFHANISDTTEIGQVYEPLLKKLNATAGVYTQYRSFPMPSVHEAITELLLVGDSDGTGSIALLFSRLFSRDLLTSKDGPARLASAMSKLRYTPGEAVSGMVVGGGAVADNAGKVDNAVSPAWREAVVHVVYTRSWSPNATLAEQQAVIKNVTDVELPLLQGVEGADKMGAYVNEAFAYEPHFQESFWGRNYPRLYRSKQKWDPAGLFIARRMVGSEDWDDQGLCRIAK
ncbi:hypothetical protein Aspvir_007903 [Aspergillus viridinutans]|uniref:FAD-binding PCMH-type domain-containing protein n=1 Tax=Aspergillus viridinutans TaxID=75553 RepID=A0A9P3C072_ASPVI|nr:uncharacterized protein Aspvir_007903 [Aspergillus viridinutans]GIK03828.1 hypothetical protein Aspvir_007903 [Aspergillus viridinutans]